MSADPNKKTARTFQCRDVLWDTFEQLARELECSVDYLVNEAMKQYARQRAHGATRTPYPGGREASQSGVAPPALQPGASVTAPPSVPAAPSPAIRKPTLSQGVSIPGPIPPPPSRMPPPPGRPSASLPAPPPRASAIPAPPTMPGRVLGAPPPLPTSSGASVVPPPIPAALRPPAGAASARSVPPPPPATGTAARPVALREATVTNGRGPAEVAPPNATLTLVYNGERFPINKDRFVIGRGKQSSDLTLKDPNVSRQHALIEFQGGTYFMVDMGSTNGVAYNGQRIARRAIAEGDVFKICDHDFLFTYR